MKDYKIELATNDDRQEMSKLIENIFKSYTFLPLNMLIDSDLEYDMEEYSLKMTIDGIMIGIHVFFNNELDFRPQYCGELEEEFGDKKGIQGFMFGIHPDFQKQGYGKAFIQFEREFFKGKFDYIWGNHDKRLNNIEFWKETRDVFFEKYDETDKDTRYTTVMKI